LLAAELVLAELQPIKLSSTMLTASSLLFVVLLSTTLKLPHHANRFSTVFSPLLTLLRSRAKPKYSLTFCSRAPVATTRLGGGKGKLMDGSGWMAVDVWQWMYGSGCMAVDVWQCEIARTYETHSPRPSTARMAPKEVMQNPSTSMKFVQVDKLGLRTLKQLLVMDPRLLM